EHGREKGKRCPNREGRAPSPGDREWYGGERSDKRSHRHEDNIECGDGADRTGEVALHNRWKQDIQYADSRERERAIGEKPDGTSRHRSTAETERQRDQYYEHRAL